MKSFLESFLEGDRRVYHEIYNSETSTQIRKDVIYKGGTPEEAEDVLVLTILKARELARAGKYIDQDKFYGFLRTVGYYVSKEQRNKNAKAAYRTEEVLVDEDYSQILEAGGKLRPIAEEQEDFEEKLAISRFIDSLGERDQMIVRLRYFDGLPLVDIGEQLDIKQPNVVHHRILKKLRKLLNHTLGKSKQSRFK